MIKIGMMIGDRYEILEKIGTGGMSDVYKAKCHKLNRFVAIKVLKQEFSENANFVSKFRTEAQAAAGLMHPNIVNVYDVGEEDDIYYIVMELVEGITLKKYIEKKARLSFKEAVSIAIQVSMGIEAAHNNHIIHRDIKPQNIVFDPQSKRVAFIDYEHSRMGDYTHELFRADMAAMRNPYFSECWQLAKQEFLAEQLNCFYGKEYSRKLFYYELFYDISEMTYSILIGDQEQVSVHFKGIENKLRQF